MKINQIKSKDINIKIIAMLELIGADLEDIKSELDNIRCDVDNNKCNCK